MMMYAAAEGINGKFIFHGIRISLISPPPPPTSSDNACQTELQHNPCPFTCMNLLPWRIQIYFKQFWWKVLATEFHVTQVPYKKRYTWTPDGHPTAMQRNPSGGKQSTSGSGWACPRGRCPYLLNIHRAGDLLSRLSSRRGWVPMADATSAGSQLKSRTLILLII